MDGALIVDKPSGPSSHDVVAVARRVLQTRQVGHAGTLDPLATGVLVLLVGRATRLSQFIVHDEKEYLAGIRLGVVTATYDAEGISGNSQLPIPNSQLPTPNSQLDQIGNWELGVGSLENVLDGFRGTFPQKPPPFSAKKIAGRPAYAHARADRVVEMKAIPVTVKQLERLPSVDPSLVQLRVVVSAGFYVRSLAHDLGQRLGCGAHLESLRRTRSGPFAVDAAVPFHELVAGAPRLIGVNDLLSNMPAVTLSEEELKLASHGNAIGQRQVSGDAAGLDMTERVRLLGPGGNLVAIARPGPDALLHPQVVLV
jgi:tRNA pseudouridine55 synthase